MLVQFRKTAVIIDQLAFRRARVESFLKPWAKAENVELISLQPEFTHAMLLKSGCDILIYNVGGARPSPSEILAEIQVLHRLCPTAALVILSGDTNPQSVSAALHSGARGYLSDSMPPGLALHALSFILNGGTYFPTTAIPSSQSKPETSAAEPPQSSFEDLPQKPSVHAQEQMSSSASDGDALQPPPFPLGQTTFGNQQSIELSAIQCDPVQLAGAEPQLTLRQQAILRCICRGDSNKTIARSFDIAESTVKIHVKVILRKIGVKNRTQAAIWAIHNGLSSASETSDVLSKASVAGLV
jgi:DNA-binding NarL/FixJ family response regulator